MKKNKIVKDDPAQILHLLSKDIDHDLLDNHKPYHKAVTEVLEIKKNYFLSNRYF
jgi:hypothetical protein